MKLEVEPTESGPVGETGQSPSAPATLPHVVLCDRRIHAITTSQCIRHVLNELSAGRGGWIVTHNLDHLRRLVRDDSFAELCTHATVAVADGMPLVWACRLQGTPLPERVAGSDLVPQLSAAAAEADRTIFLLGGAPGTAEAAADVLRRRHPNLNIVGTLCPQPGFEERPADIAHMAEAVKRAAPDIVFVALGSPKQEVIIRQFRGELPAAWWLGVGISFSFLSGDVRRAPRWMQRCGLEWFHRLLQEPVRLARRYLLQGIPFALWLLAHAARHRVIGTRAQRESGAGGSSASEVAATNRHRSH